MFFEFLLPIFGFITDHIVTIIFLFVAAESALVATAWLLMKRHQNVLMDVSDNMIKGFEDRPDFDSNSHTLERIHSAIQFISNKGKLDPQARLKFKENARKLIERPFYTRHYQIEVLVSLFSTIVQVFPLLGILGTILAIAQTAGGSVTADPSTLQLNVQSLSGAFVLAMNTTILGIFFSILFMVIESVLLPRVERLIGESQDFKKLISQLYLG